VTPCDPSSGTRVAPLPCLRRARRILPAGTVPRVVFTRSRDRDDVSALRAHARRRPLRQARLRLRRLLVTGRRCSAAGKVTVGRASSAARRRCCGMSTGCVLGARSASSRSPSCTETDPPEGSTELHGNQPCPDDLAPYLEASYQCLPGNCRFHRRVSVSIRLSVIRPCSTETSGWIKL